MKKLISFLVILMVGIWWVTSSRSTKTVSTPIPLSDSKLIQSQTASVSPQMKKDSTESSSALLKVDPPNIEDLREEVRQDPHTPPSSLIKFSIQLAKSTEKALESEDLSVELLKKLEDCVLDKRQSSLHSVQALCLKNAHKLGETYASLSPQVQNLFDQADPEAQRIARTIMR